MLEKVADSARKAEPYKPLLRRGGGLESDDVKGEVKAKIKISPVVVFGVLSRMVVVRGS